MANPEYGSWVERGKEIYCLNRRFCLTDKILKKWLCNLKSKVQGRPNREVCLCGRLVTLFSNLFNDILDGDVNRRLLRKMRREYEIGEMTGSESSGKRSRDPEDAVYLDNFHSHKRYLSEMMASSLNGLTVGDTLTENHRTSVSGFDPLDSPARSEAIGYSRDEFYSPYSPMSEDSDDSRCCEPSLSTSMAQTDSCSRPTSPVSPCRHHHRSVFGCPTTPSTFPASSLCIPSLVMGSSQQRQRSSDSEGRFPSSPSDICHSPDLRRAALLRSVQMKAQPQRPLAFELQSGTRPAIQHFEETDSSSCSFVKPMVDERGYPFGPTTRSLERVQNLLLEDCSSMGIAEHHSCQQNCYRRIHLKDDAGRGTKESEEEIFGGNGVQTELLSGGRRSVLGQAKACSAYK